MQPSTTRWSVQSALELAFELSGDKASSSHVRLRASDIDALIARLAHHRATMTPEIPRMMPDLKEVATATDPIWVLHAPASTRDKLLFIRHPGLGWLMFQLPPSEAAKLGHGLLSGRLQQMADRLSSKGSLH